MAAVKWYLAADGAFGRLAIATAKLGKPIPKPQPEPREQFLFCFASELTEVTLGFEKRLLHQVRPTSFGQKPGIQVVIGDSK